MKRFLLSKAEILLGGIFMACAIPFCFKTNSILVAALELLTAVITGFLCRQLLFYPFDLLIGKKTTECYYEGCIWADQDELSPKRYFLLWRFFIGSKKLDFWVPKSYLQKDFLSVEEPPNNRPLKVTYYSLSKLLCGWEAGQGTVNAKKEGVKP